MKLEVADFSNLDVLVAEDNRFVRILVREVLNAFGAGTVREVSNGEDAILQVRKKQPDLIISDWVMQPIDGLSLLRKLRSFARTGSARIPVIILSGHATDGHVTQALGEGADSYIVKPFNASTLMSHILKVACAKQEVTYLD